MFKGPEYTSVLVEPCRIKYAVDFKKKKLNVTLEFSGINAEFKNEIIPLLNCDRSWCGLRLLNIILK